VVILQQANHVRGLKKRRMLYNYYKLLINFILVTHFYFLWYWAKIAFDKSFEKLRTGSAWMWRTRTAAV